MWHVLPQSLKASDLVGIKHDCHCLTSAQEKKVAGTGKEGSRYHFCFECSRILMLFPCCLLKEASENRKGKVTQRTGPFMLEPTQMDDCQMHRSKIESSSTLNLYQASWRNFSENFTFHKNLCFNKYLWFPFNLQILQHSFTISVELLHICSINFFSLKTRTNLKLCYKNVKAAALKLNPILSKCELEYFLKSQ